VVTDCETLTAINNDNLIIIILSGVRLSPLGTAATNVLLTQPHMIDDGDCGPIGGSRIGRGNRSTRRKPAPAPLCPPQIPLDNLIIRYLCEMHIYVMWRPCLSVRIFIKEASGRILFRFILKVYEKTMPGEFQF
jgi:hypothetical protein